MKKIVSYMDVVNSPGDEVRLLMQLVTTLSESYNADLPDTKAAIEKAILALQLEISKRGQNTDEFDRISTFVVRLIKSDRETFNEFLRYLEHNQFH